MKKAFDQLSAIFTALLPFLGLNLVGVFIINDSSPIIGYSIATAILALSLYLSSWVYRLVLKMGIISFMGTVSASPDLDDPAVTESSEHKLRTPQEIAQLINQNNHLCKGGSIRVFGDWHKQHGESFHSLEKATYSAFDRKLTLHFDQAEQIEINKPLRITEGTTYLKIKSASKIVFKFTDNQTQCALEFTNQRKGVEVSGTCNDINKKVIVSMSAPALMIN